MKEYLNKRISTHEAYIRSLNEQMQLQIIGSPAYQRLKMEHIIVSVQLAETLLILNNFLNQNRAQQWKTDATTLLNGLIPLGPLYWSAKAINVKSVRYRTAQSATMPLINNL